MWPRKAAQAALALSGSDEEAQSPGSLLLADIRSAFAECGSGKMGSAALVEALVAMEERPWGECRHGKPINQNWLSRRLVEFKIHSKNLRPTPGAKPVKGYEREAFADAFSRYLPETGLQSVTPL